MIRARRTVRDLIIFAIAANVFHALTAAMRLWQAWLTRKTWAGQSASTLAELCRHG